MKSMKKILALLLAMTMVMGLVACGNQNEPDNSQTPPNNTQTPDDTPTPTEPKVWDDLSTLDHEGKSEVIFEEALGEYWDYYETGRLEVLDIGLRYALMAQAEAKLLEAAVMLPGTANGGGRGMTRIAPHSGAGIFWGYDQDRQHYRIVTAETITPDDRAEMVAKWGELKGTGEYLSWAKEYLVGKGYTLKDTFDYADGSYSSDPSTWDVLSTSKQPDAEPVVQTFTGLIEYDAEDQLQPAMAESWEKSEDGLTWTFHIRQGVKWYDQQGREIADVKADDWVAGFQHMLDAKGGLESLMRDYIVGSGDYIDGVTADFSTVGVKALDEYTLQYSLSAPCPYFEAMVTYGPFAPLCRTYYESQGGKFGAEYNPNAASYTYGKGPDSIAYNGPYFITSYTEKNSIVYKANENYWDPENINVHTITWRYNDGSDTMKAYEDFKANINDAVGITASILEQVKLDGLEGDIYISSTDANNYPFFFNANRGAYAAAIDETIGVSPKTEEQKAQTKAAMRNQHFRMALARAFDRVTYNAQSRGDELASTNICNMYTPGDFVYLPNDATIDINGTPTTFEAGTNFGVITQAQLDADGYGDIKAYDPTANDGSGSSGGYDGWYNPEAARAELAQAIAELAEYGIEISAENPVQLDMPVLGTSEIWLNRGYSVKQKLEENLNGMVEVNIMEMQTADDFYAVAFDPESGDGMCYDINPLSGWGPDYGDPSTYLDTLLPYGDGYMAKCIGLW